MLPIMTSLTDQFRARVDAFLEATGFKPTEFGRQAVGDPSFVLGLRRGRSPTLATADRVLAFISQVEAAETRRHANRTRR
jgi:hypothetical protein